MTSFAVNDRIILQCSPAEAFAAWIDPVLLPKWLAPPPWTLRTAMVDPRAGGQYRHEIIGNEGRLSTVTGEFLEFEPDKHMKRSWKYTGLHPAPRPEATFVAVSFEPGEAGTTVMQLTHMNLRDEREQRHYREGWSACFDRLRHLLSTDTPSPRA